MPTYASPPFDPPICVYTDLVFYSGVDGLEDGDVDLVLADTENIGARNLPTVFKLSTLIESNVGTALNLGGIDVEFHSTTSGYLQEGYEGVDVVYSGKTTISGFVEVGGNEPAHVDYWAVSSECLLDWFVDTGIAYRVGTSGFDERNVHIDFDIGQPYDVYEDFYVEYPIVTQCSGNKYYIVGYEGGEKKEAGLPGHVLPESYDVSVGFHTSMFGFENVPVDIIFNGWVLDNYIDFDLFSCVFGTKYTTYETTVTGGGLHGYYADVSSVVSGTESISHDIFCCLTDYIDFPFESTVISGSVDGIYGDVWSRLLSADKYVSFDVLLLSLKIFNFSLAVGEYASAFGTICVDVTDDWYPVSTSGTYFVINETQVSGTFTPIIDGYRMCYDPMDDFSSLMGPTEVVVHAENDNNDVLEKSYYLTYGYSVEYYNFEAGGIDFGYGNKVVVRMSAENFSSCPKVSTDAYWFETGVHKRSDLGVSIRGIGKVTSGEDLSASIYPQSTAFFYDKEYVVVVNAQDYSGNIMKPFEFKFRIENLN